MIKIILLGALLFATSVKAEVPEITLAKAPVNIHDIESIKRGAKFFSNVCIACHTLIYMRYDKIAKEAGITYERMPINVKVWPLNVTPPDLSVETDAKGVDWVYTYLHSFYLDPSSKTGFNNLVLPNTAMTDIMAPFQGTQILAKDIKLTQNMLGNALQWYDVLELQKQGSLTPAQFDQLVTDIVNFLAYSAEPFKAEQEKLGGWVLGFLVIFFILAYCLKREYWKDLKKE